jgi:hypothetical protein
MIPLIIFAFNRPDKLRRVIAAVKQQTQKPDVVIGIVDGPRNDDDVNKIRRCCLEMETVADEIITSDRNLGCAANIMGGVNQIMERYGAAVVLEDDTLPARTWYEAMCSMLRHYVTDDVVGAVGSYPSILKGSLPGYQYDVLLSPRFSCWGWGTYQHKWHTVYDEWLKYRATGSAPFDLGSLPGHAGGDIANMIASHPPGQLWDGVLAGSFLHHGLLQAIPRYYLIHNIGADIHVSQSKIEFMLSNNVIEERVPIAYPPLSLDADVGAAVRSYVNAMSN